MHSSLAKGTLLICMLAILVGVRGQLNFDCRRKGVVCQGDAADPTADYCQVTGSCSCPDGKEGYNCGLTTADKETCPNPTECQNKATCLKDGGCFCSPDTYGPKCQNFRVQVWCTDSEMFININPEVEGTFEGLLFVAADDLPEGAQPARNNSDCDLTTRPISSDTDLPGYVLDVNGVTPTDLAGFYMQLQHNGTEKGGTSACGSATEQPAEDGSRMDYIRRVVIEYNSAIMSSLDQLFNLNCSVVNTTNITSISSFKAASVSIINDDYQQVNVSDTIEPVSFELKDANDRAITNSIRLGDQVNLKFTLTSSSFTNIKVTKCDATTGVEGATRITFFQNDCPVPDWASLFRGDLVHVNTAAEKSMTLQLSAFRFAGDSDTVVFICDLQLCKTENDSDCVRRPCGAAAQAPATSPPDTTVSTAAPAETTVAPGEVTTAPVTGGAVRRKRSADEPGVQTVNKSLSVLAGQSQAPVQDSTQAEVEETDCMAHNEVIVIVVTFSVALALLIILVIALVIRLLRSRVKVVDSSDVASADSQSHYTLPRLSVANF